MVIRYLYCYMPPKITVLECKHTKQVFVMLSIWSLFRCFCYFCFCRVSYNMGGCWNHNVWQQNHYKQYIYIDIFWFYSLHFLLALKTIVLFTNYICKQITRHGRPFEFPEAKVIKLGVEHYDYNISRGNNNIWHNDDDDEVMLNVLRCQLTY